MSEPETDDRELLQRWREGDSRAGNQLLRRHFMVVTKFFERRVDSNAQEELIQLTFMGAVSSRDRVPEGVRFKAYLLGIARKQLLMFLRKRQRHGSDLPLVDEPLAGSSIAPSRIVAAAEEGRVLLRALAQLPADMQTAVELHYFEELSTREIAEVLDCAPGTVKAWLHRARARLRAAIAEMKLPAALANSTLVVLERRDAAAPESLV